MKIPRRTKLATAISLAMMSAAGLSLPAHAETTFKVSGYGTAAVTFTDNNDYEFRSSMNQSVGTGKDLDPFVDSKLGLQGVAGFGHGFSITGQILGQRKREARDARSNNDFHMDFEWLYGQYSPTSNLDFRLGRVVLPAFMISDSRNVGYSQGWLRAPTSVYAAMPLTNIDGGQINWRIPMGSAIVTVQPTYGRSNTNIQASSIVIDERSRYTAGLNLSLEYGDWLVRAGRVRSKMRDADFAPFGDAAGGIVTDINDTFTSAGLQYDNGQAVFMAEWTQRKMDPDLPSSGNALWAFIAPPELGGATLAQVYAARFAGAPLTRSDAFYVAGGWRFGSVMPMLAFGQTKGYQTGVKTRELIASVRYDFMTNVALKAQWTRVNARDGQTFVSSASADTHPDWNKKINAFSVGLDFVF